MKFILPEANPMLMIVTVANMDTRWLSPPAVNSVPPHKGPHKSPRWFGKHRVRRRDGLGWGSSSNKRPILEI